MNTDSSFFKLQEIKQATVFRHGVRGIGSTKYDYFMSI